MELIPLVYRLVSLNNKTFSSLEEGKLQLQNYAFTQGFVLASTSFQKGKIVFILDCMRYEKKTRNTRHIEDEDPLRQRNKVQFDNC